MKMKLLQANCFVLSFDMPDKWHFDTGQVINEKLIKPIAIHYIR